MGNERAYRIYHISYLIACVHSHRGWAPRTRSFTTRGHRRPRSCGSGGHRLPCALVRRARARACSAFFGLCSVCSLPSIHLSIIAHALPGTRCRCSRHVVRSPLPTSSCSAFLSFLDFWGQRTSQGLRGLCRAKGPAHSRTSHIKSIFGSETTFPSALCLIRPPGYLVWTTTFLLGVGLTNIGGVGRY
jgi:hypothetical protein